MHAVLKTESPKHRWMRVPSSIFSDKNDQKEATQINRPKTLKQNINCFVCSQKYCIMFLLNRQLPSKPLPKNFDVKQQETISYLTQLKTALYFMQNLTY